MSKTIVITGAGSGLGKTFAKHFAERGEQVVLLGRTLSKLATVAEEIGNRATAIECDVGNAASVVAAFQAVAEQFGKIDVLINNAAYVDRVLCEEASDPQIIMSYTTNLIGPTLCAREAIPLINAGGSIVNISSGAVDNNYPGYAIYAASKAGLERLSLGLYEELKPRDICVSYVRCGQMVEEVGNWENLDPQVQKMLEEAIKMGQDPRQRPSSAFSSVAQAVDNLINLPPDLRSPSLTLKPRALP
ncbi:SDR family oxidoreductase [Halioxenophilus sp. WMMB6]|uniref:SDR family oxidoreductase n=1 Tax=Halioxenophilus sp. WMMB6 TaxID=3073815 RepID=UPI00295E49E2|nr:SDR family oxidoreductase [Halioxenophilus sp. WMMB6]